MEERENFDHAEIEPASGSVAIHCPGFPIIKPEHYIYIYIYILQFRDTMTHAAG
jgi:hypothetical protein